MTKSLIRVMLANIANMLIIAATNFILPLFTSVETYAATKEYTLYITTFSSLVTLGYTQGIYLKYGGKELSTFKKGEVGTDYLSFLVIQLPICAVFSIVGLFSKNITLVILGFGLLCTNLTSYYQYLYQAVGDFKAYGLALNASKIMLLIFYIVLILFESFVIKSVHYAFFVFAQALATTVTAVVLTIVLNKRIKVLSGAGFSYKTALSNMRLGFVLMIGGFVSTLFSTIGRWFVNTLMDTTSFAVYSFGVSIENLVISFMTPITVSMYNFFCRGIDNEKIKDIKDSVTIYSFVLIAAAFPAKWIIEKFMPTYIGAVSIIFLLFAAQGLGTVVKGIHVNLYKARGQQVKYLKQIVAMVIISLILNAAMFFLFGTIEAVAAATLITNIIWFIVAEIQNRDVKCSLRTALSIVIVLTAYLLCGHLLGAILGAIIYCAVGLITAFTLMRRNAMQLLKKLLDMLKKGKGATNESKEIVE